MMVFCHKLIASLRLGVLLLRPSCAGVLRSPLHQLAGGVRAGCDVAFGAEANVTSELRGSSESLAASLRAIVYQCRRVALLSQRQ